MNFWKQLRLIGSAIVLLIAVLAIVLAVLRPSDSTTETPAAYTAPGLKAQSGTTGL